MTTFACQFAFIAAFVTFSSFSYLFIIPFLSPLFNQINYSYKINTINYVVIIPRRTTKCRERSGHHQARRGGGRTMGGVAAAKNKQHYFNLKNIKKYENSQSSTVLDRTS